VTRSADRTSTGPHSFGTVDNRRDGEHRASLAKCGRMARLRRISSANCGSSAINSANSSALGDSEGQQRAGPVRPLRDAVPDATNRETGSRKNGAQKTGEIDTRPRPHSRTRRGAEGYLRISQFGSTFFSSATPAPVTCVPTTRSCRSLVNPVRCTSAR